MGSGLCKPGFKPLVEEEKKVVDLPKDSEDDEVDEILIGFWETKADVLREPKWIISNSDRDYFLSQLHGVQAMICSMPDQGFYITGLKPSMCHLCGVMTGREEYSALVAEDTNIVWPSGYAHYLSEHKIAPNDIFHTFIEEVYKKNLSKFPVYFQ